MKRALVLVAVIAVVGAWLGAAEAAGPLELKASVLLGSPARDLVLDDSADVAYVATDQGLAVVNISNPLNPVQCAALGLGGKSYGIKRQGSLIFVANVTTGLRAVDVSTPCAPRVVGTKVIPYKAWDVAVKDDIVYAVSYAGEMYVLQYVWTNPTKVDFIPKKVIGLLAWSSAAHDAGQLTKMNNHVTSGNAKVTGVAVKGNVLITVDFAYGRIFYYNVTNAANPVFSGTHYAPFMFRIDMFHPEDDPEQTVVYALAASGGVSGIYSLPVSVLGPSFSTRYTTCDECGYFKTPVTDFGGLTVSENGRYVVYLAGKTGVIQVLDASDPSNIVPAPGVNLLPIAGHYTKLAEPMGAQTDGDFIFAAVGALGLRVYKYDGLSAP